MLALFNQVEVDEVAHGHLVNKALEGPWPGCRDPVGIEVPPDSSSQQLEERWLSAVPRL
jgi:hypothetical protein